MPGGYRCLTLLAKALLSSTLMTLVAATMSFLQHQKYVMSCIYYALQAWLYSWLPYFWKHLPKRSTEQVSEAQVMQCGLQELHSLCHARRCVPSRA
jgi:hypothetical protein